jgi:uncharacterized protein YbaP (TraB family)
MKNFFFCLTLLFTTLFACSSAVESNTSFNDIDTKAKNNNSLLWSIEKEGHKKSYIYGTMHMIEPEYYNFSDKLKQLIISADKIVMEIGGEPNPIEAYNLMILDSGTVEDYFTKEQLSQLIEFMDKQLNTPPKEFRQKYSKMKPFLILQVITQAYFSKDAVSYDLNIMQLAYENNIPIDGFETMEQQLSFFDQISNKDMAILIISSINNFDDEKKETLKLQKLYAKQKVDKLIPLMKKQSPELMEFEDIFLNNRNKNWIPQINMFTNENRCFIAVGAAHLFGKKGVLEHLKREGYKILPLKL